MDKWSYLEMVLPRSGDVPCAINDIEKRKIKVRIENDSSPAEGCSSNFKVFYFLKGIPCGSPDSETKTRTIFAPGEINLIN